MLPLERVVAYLIERQLLDPEQVIRGEVVVADTSRRNQDFHVIAAPASSYFLKQGDEAAGVGSVPYESVIYTHASANGGQFDTYLPHSFGYDSTHRLLILELLSQSTNMREYQLGRTPRFPAKLGACLGNMVAAIHTATADAAAAGWAERGITLDPPAVLSIACPPLDLLRNISAANVQLIKRVQQFAEFRHLLQDVRNQWRSEALIHGDLRWDNCMILPRRAGRRELRLVDWEFARLGDPCWDVGCVFSEYLSAWLLALPNVPSLDVDRLLQFNAVSLADLQPSVRAFWRAYARCRCLHADTAAEWLLRAVRYSAARLVEMACEHLHSRTELTLTAGWLLQTSFNMLSRPANAAAELLGIEDLLSGGAHQEAGA